MIDLILTKSGVFTTVVVRIVTVSVVVPCLTATNLTGILAGLVFGVTVAVGEATGVGVTLATTGVLVAFACGVVVAAGVAVGLACGVAVAAGVGVLCACAVAVAFGVPVALGVP